MEHFTLFYLGGFAVVMIVLAYIGLRQDGIDAWQVVRTFIRKVFEAVGVLILGCGLAVGLSWAFANKSLLDPEGMGLLVNTWWMIGFVLLPSIVIIWHSVVKEARRKAEEEKRNKKRHLLKLRS